MAWIGVLIGFIVMHYAYMVSDHAVRRAYRRGCRAGLQRGYQRCYRDIMEHRADRDELIAHAELIIEEAEKNDTMWAQYVQSCGKINPWYRSDN